jgi:hypothetical protein
MDRFLELLWLSTPLQWLIAFLVLTVTDVCWAMYTVSANKGSGPLPASCWAVALFLLGGMAVVGYTTNPVLLIPSAIGAFVGTYLGIIMSRK